MNDLDQIAKEKIFQRAALSRAFETEVFNQVKIGNIKIPVYLSAGQEYISATLSVALENMGVGAAQVFIQHRGHSTYLSFGGNLIQLALELLGESGGCSNGMGGSASIQSKEANIYGHDGLMGSQGPIAVGMSFANRLPTLCFAGDAAAEEDYFLTSIGWAATKKLPIWFVVEDNNLSILTEKKVRRSWEIDKVAGGMGISAFSISDDPNEIFSVLPSSFQQGPLLLNICTNRLFWHAGAGIDSNEIFDRHVDFGNSLDPEFVKITNNAAQERVNLCWEQALKSCEK
jgi:TPP-dependent pyruvate/acetoin dehydrogenase alpha subunit